MQRMTIWLHLLLLLFHPLTQVHPEEVDKVPVEVIVDSSPCSTTCGLGIKTQTMCFLKDGETAMEEDARSKDGAELSKECRVRKVKCQESWQCGLRTMTVTSGQRVEMDCVEEIMEAMGKFSWRVSWRYARGIISSDDTLFTRRDAPLLDRVVLDPVTEEDAGTYRCDVQDASFRRVKRVYWGIHVLPDGFLNLDYESSLAQWNSTGNQTVPDQHVRRKRWIYAVLITYSITCVIALVILVVYWREKRRVQTSRDIQWSELIQAVPQLMRDGRKTALSRTTLK
ncbi:Transmembrane protein 81, partial [Larimichthys crocea]